MRGTFALKPSVDTCTLRAIKWVRQTRLNNINYMLHLLATILRVEQDDFPSQILHRVLEALGSLVYKMESLRQKDIQAKDSKGSADNKSDAYRRGWCCEKLVALLACVRTFCLVTEDLPSTIDTSLISRGLVEMLSIAGENDDPLLLAQSEALIIGFASSSSSSQPATDLLVLVAEALAKEADGSGSMEYRLGGLQKLISLPGLADQCAGAMRAGLLDNVFVAMEGTRKQQKSYTGLADKIWSLLRRLGGL